MTPSDLPKKPYHHGALKQALVLAGIEILESEGLAALSLRAIAARVGVSHTAPKNHFDGLRGLRTAIATEGFVRHAAFMREGLSISAPSRKARQEAAMQGYVRFATTHPHLFRLMFSTEDCSFDDPALLEAARQSYAVLAGISERLDWDKSSAPDAQRRAELMLWSMVHGFATLALAGYVWPEASTGLPMTIAQIMPDFGYLE